MVEKANLNLKYFRKYIYDSRKGDAIQSSLLHWWSSLIDFNQVSVPVLMFWLTLLMILLKVAVSLEKEVLVFLMQVIFY